MQNFSFKNPTKIIFGKGSIAKLSREIPQNARVLLLFGGGSVKRNGVYDQVKAALDGYTITEFWGIESNPTVETCREAIALGREKQCDFVLAVGGGSVIDATKLITASLRSDKEPWSIVTSGVARGPFVPFGTVLTIPATGSEMNCGSVISRRETNEKFAFHGQFPTFSVIDPESTYSLPKYQLACGIADSFAHVLEQYMTFPGQSRVMDRWAEGLLLTLLEIAPKIVWEEPDYDLRCDFCITATMALNRFIAWGVVEDWATHMIGHELTALTGITHGHSLAIIFPALLRVTRECGKHDKLLQYAERIWHIAEGSEEERIEAAIDQTEAFFHSLGLETRLEEKGIRENTINEIVRRFKERDVHYGEAELVDASLTEQILHSAFPKSEKLPAIQPFE